MQNFWTFLFKMCIFKINFTQNYSILDKLFFFYILMSYHPYVMIEFGQFIPTRA